MKRDQPKGRGTSSNRNSRFDRVQFESQPDDEWIRNDPWLKQLGEWEPAPTTVIHSDQSRSIFGKNDSPDLPFSLTLNPYRGCEHGCTYCYARPTHEYLGFSAGLDFESQIVVKHDAAALLREEFSKPRWRPQVIAVSGVTDCYQPLERKLQITRQCLAVFAEFRNPVMIVTKSGLIVRDLDLLQELAKHQAVAVAISITTLDSELANHLEPRAAQPQRRLAIIERLAAAEIPTQVMLGPVIPGLNDHEIPEILNAAAAAGARSASWIALRLPHSVKELFSEWLEQHRPDRRRRVLAAIHSIRGGRLNDPRFGSRMRGEGLLAKQIDQLFNVSRRRTGLDQPVDALNTRAFRRPGPSQGCLFS